MGRSVNGNDADPLGGSDELPEHTTAVAAFHLDRFEVTVGRFREFVEQYDGTPPAADAGAHPLISGSGWQSSWNTSLPSSQAELIATLENNIDATWTNAVAANENAPINCVSWYEAFAFCIWDDGRLPTEAEWEMAAAGGTDNRLYPWGQTTPSQVSGHANWSLDGNSPLIAVGSRPLGQARWGQDDLAGGLFEWTLDWHSSSWYSGAGGSCNNCANLTRSGARIKRGGNWVDNGFGAEWLRAALRGTPGGAPSNHGGGTGLRCARSP
jgi:formylglycine-generating enzyme required for sulfatase activity